MYTSGIVSISFRSHSPGEILCAAAVAEAHGVILCLECHRRSYTETKEGALALMQYADSPNS